MEQQTIQLKGMVCHRCIMTVENELQALGHRPVSVSLGEISYIAGNEHDLAALELRLNSLGFSLLVDKKKKMTKDAKKIIKEVYNGDYDFPERFRFTDLLKQRLQKDYEGISDAFVATEGKTIEQYIIQYRINKVKEFLVYSNLTLADIAFRLNFNSVAHLSAQFKQYTGLTPSHFKSVKREKADLLFSNN